MAKYWKIISLEKCPTNYYEVMTIEETYCPNFIMKLIFKPHKRKRKFYGNSTVWYELPTFRCCDENESEKLMSLQRQWHYENHEFEPLVYLNTHYN